jgi:hypothetical protein
MPAWSDIFSHVAAPCPPSTEEKAIDMRPVNFGVAGRAVLVSQRRLVMEIGCVGRADFVRIAVTLETKLPYI